MPAVGSVANLLRQIIRFADLRDELELGLEPVGMVLFALEHLFEHVARAVVPAVEALADAPVEPVDRLPLEVERKGQLLADGLADPDRSQSLEIRYAVEVEDALDEVFGILHLVDRFVVEALRQAVVAPVRAHLRVDEVLVDRGQLAREHLVQQLGDAGVTLHGPNRIPRTARRRPGSPGDENRRPPNVESDLVTQAPDLVDTGAAARAGAA